MRGSVRVFAAFVAALFAVLLAGSPASASVLPAPRVVLVAVPDLRWSDVVHMPRLLALARTATVGNLSVRTSGEATRCGDGLLELSAGTRVPSGVVACPPSTDEFDRLGRIYRSAPFKPRVGTLPGPIPTAPGLRSFLDTGLYGASTADRQQRRDELDTTISQQLQGIG
ncbi:MAG: hypothetical protein JO079_14400, partial [Frankiaceae bacterium]|nr:hypothetical protein [Frankiaceae bacterium]MBV9369038.1 hypothetical protein [Frankiales bacterium]